MVFVEAPQSTAELDMISRELHDVPTLVNFIEGGKTPIESTKQLSSLGFNAVLYSTSGLLGAMRAYHSVYSCIANEGSSHTAQAGQLASFDDLKQMFNITGEKA